MKKYISLVLLMIVGIMSRAQTFDEWFRQKKTQISYLTKQIAALEAYHQVTEEGYQIVQAGTGLITDTRKTDYEMHSGYFSSLLAVNPVILQDPKVDGILDLSSQILVVAGQARQLAEKMPGWVETVNLFFDALVSGCSDDMDWLKSVTGNGDVSMTDDQRIGAIDRLYDRMKKRYNDAIRARNDIIIMTFK
jgi:hypothetical protein